MEYLKAALSLISLIRETNSILLKHSVEIVNSPNQMWIKMPEGDSRKVLMDSYTNDFVLYTLDSLKNTEAFVMTDIDAMDVKGQDYIYLLYKGYHRELEKGIVCYQLINKISLAPIGELQFSNMEENIFYTIEAPGVEESSCNAMETDKNVEGGKNIIFLIGHMNEARLAYDIQRLIFDTVNNVTRHPTLNFNFTIHISRYGGKPSSELKERVSSIENFTSQYICSEYPNTQFEFSYEQDGMI